MPTATPGIGAFLVGETSTSSADAGLLALANPEGRDVILTDFIMDIQVASTAAHAFSFDVVNASTTLGSAGLFNAIASSVAGPFRSSGLPKLWKSTQYVVGGSTSGDLGIFAGKVYARWVGRSST